MVNRCLSGCHFVDDCRHAAFLFRLHRRHAPPQYDMLIRNGTVIECSGRAGYRADVAIKGDRIERIGKLTMQRHTCDRRAGKVVARASLIAGQSESCL